MRWVERIVVALTHYLSNYNLATCKHCLIWVCRYVQVSTDFIRSMSYLSAAPHCSYTHTEVHSSCACHMTPWSTPNLTTVHYTPTLQYSSQQNWLRHIKQCLRDGRCTWIIHTSWQWWLHLNNGWDRHQRNSGSAWQHTILLRRHDPLITMALLTIQQVALPKHTHTTALLWPLTTHGTNTRHTRWLYI